jgi:hypothetical protein
VKYPGFRTPEFGNETDNTVADEIFGSGILGKLFNNKK